MLFVVSMVFLMPVNTLFLKNNTLEEIRNGQTPDVDGYKGHLRECYVVAAPDADKAKIENEIKTMENYFVGYETVVNFISQEELDRNHKGIPHGGFVLRSGESTKGTRHVIEYSLKLDPTLNSQALHLLLTLVVSTALLNMAAQVATLYSIFHQLGFPHILLKN